jgi:hypothetical protein
VFRDVSCSCAALSCEFNVDMIVCFLEFEEVHTI